MADEKSYSAILNSAMSIMSGSAILAAGGRGLRLGGAQPKQLLSIGGRSLLERSVSETPTLARKVHTAMRAAVRGADLTRRLLAFARRQILDPVVVDANRQLSGLTELMQRTLGESVEVHMVQAHDLWHTRVDAGQFENAILNLAINARDAMPEGGRLTVRTRNVYLDSEERTAAPALFRALLTAKKMIEDGEKDARVVKEASQWILAAEPRIRQEYFEIVDPKELQPVAEIRGAVRIAVAVWIGKTRLIDNVGAISQ